mmetsp:Transcript_11127/g.24576  ORF Transcript_11127/g.24576 Transcript_11127/m.24576 type:complete len:205 (+) Transcript_11127:902-1516(+)
MEHQTNLKKRARHTDTVPCRSNISSTVGLASSTRDSTSLTILSLDSPRMGRRAASPSVPRILHSSHSGADSARVSRGRASSSRATSRSASARGNGGPRARIFRCRTFSLTVPPFCSSCASACCCCCCCSAWVGGAHPYPPSCSTMHSSSTTAAVAGRSWGPGSSSGRRVALSTISSSRGEVAICTRKGESMGLCCTRDWRRSEE